MDDAPLARGHRLKLDLLAGLEAIPVTEPVARVPIRDDGVATLLEPGDSPVRAGGADVVLRDRAGRALLRTRLPTTGFDDPLALDPA